MSETIPEAFSRGYALADKVGKRFKQEGDANQIGRIFSDVEEWLSDELAREAEIEKYVRAYENPTYRMGRARMEDAVNDLKALPVRGSYLDVGCGRGEMLKHARRLGFRPARGTEVVPDLVDGDMVIYAEADYLPFPDDSWDVVSMFDVIEHLIPGEDETACRQLARVARHHVLITANNRPSKHGDDELHINRRPYKEWDALFREWFPGAVTRLSDRKYVSEGWRIDL